MEWVKQEHAGTGEEAMLPLCPGAFGDRSRSMMSKLDKGATATNTLRFNAGTDTLLWFYVDELLYTLFVE